MFLGVDLMVVIGNAVLNTNYFYGTVHGWFVLMSEMIFVLMIIVKITGRLYASGNVGIGTTSPDVKLHVSSGILELVTVIRKVYLYRINDVNYLSL